MNKKQLALTLSKLEALHTFNVHLEQYQTTSELASELLWLAYHQGDLETKTVVDLGTGNGILGIGALLLGASHVYFLDLDKGALEICKKNLLSLKILKKKYTLLEGDVASFDYKVDTTLMNPPFGVQKKGADKTFLTVAMDQAQAIYSIHKFESKKFIDSFSLDHGFMVEGVLKREFILRKTYAFHTKEKHTFTIGLWILRKLPSC